MNASEAQIGQKRIEDLTLKEVDMIYSLARVGEWTDLDIGRRYGIAKADVRRVIDNYVELRNMADKNLSAQPQLRQDPSLERIEKPRKRRCDTVYVTAKERQAAYRNRLKEKHRTDMQLPSPDPVTDSPAPEDEEPSVTVCEAPVPEIGPEEAETQHLACDSSPVEGHDILEDVPPPVASETCSEREELRVVDELT